MNFENTTYVELMCKRDIDMWWIKMKVVLVHYDLKNNVNGCVKEMWKIQIEAVLIDHVLKNNGNRDNI